MPVVRVSMFEGRSDDQKERLATAIADAMKDIAGSNKAAVNVIFDEVPGQNWYQGGECLGKNRMPATS